MRYFHQAPFTQQVAAGSIVTIGNFDGMHLGHQALLAELKQQAHNRGLTSSVVLFEPQPSEYFKSLAAPGRLMRLREKVAYLQSIGIEQILCLNFNQKLASLSAKAFVDDMLIQQLHAKHILIGDDFHFGAGRLGDMTLLAQYADQGAFSVSAFAAHLKDTLRVSSSLIRKVLAKGDLRLAASLLGRPFSLTSTVIYGKQRGQLMNFPTINMGLHRRVVPLKGVFAVRVSGLSDHRVVNGVANLGVRPTVGGSLALLESHLFDFSEDLYGQRLTVEFHHKLRDEVKFASFDDLKAQIARDCVSAKQFFG